MGAPHCPPRGDGASFGNHLIDRVLKVWECAAEHSDDLFGPLSIYRCGIARDMKDVLSSEKLIRRANVPPVPELLIPLAKDNILVLLG